MRLHHVNYLVRMIENALINYASHYSKKIN